MKKPAIIVIAYNRPKSLKRLLESLKIASYPSNEIHLIISIDKADDNNEVINVANSFDWNFGTKKIISHEKNLGLKKHILHSMKLVFEYENIIMLEDDLLVSIDFYNYARQALIFSKDKTEIVGVSLYNHQLNVHSTENFSPVEDGYDNWYLQFASSWGQAWNSMHIKEFLQWYDNNPILKELPSIPLNVRSWSNKSWLKFFVSYVILKNKYFLYPKISLTTNFGDEGTHMHDANTFFQVPLLQTRGKTYNFSKISESNSVYDAFFENMKLGDNLNLKNKELTVDLYGYKDEYSTKYLLSSSIKDFEIIKGFGRNLKPHDNNINFNISGEIFFLYKTSIIKKNEIKPNKYQRLTYDKKILTLTHLFIAVKILLIQKFFRR